jgi:hypothetical protein
MHAQFTFFDGPATPEQLAADDFAGRERILPAVRELGHWFRLYRMQRPDGSRVYVTIAETEQALLDGQKAIMSTELLAGEDPALLPGPDRVELYPVLDVVDINQAPASA